MVNKLEKGLAIDIGMTDHEEMVQIFDLAKALQLPVVDKGKVVGLISVFDICHNMEEKMDVRGIMTTDFQIAGAEDSVFSFSDSRQFILPFVDEEGYLQGFINRIALKCYLPNEEYLEVINEGLDKLYNELENINVSDKKRLAELRKSFDVILEDNYDGIFLTLGKGDTISINDRAMLIEDAGLSSVSLEGEKAELSFSAERGAFKRVNILQHIQKRKEFSISESVITDGGIIRAVDNFKSFEEMRSDLEKAEILADAYKSELEIFKMVASSQRDLVAESKQMKSIIELALKIGKVDTTALIQGPSGVGKGVISRFIHQNSARKDGPFVKIDCGSIPEHLLESELFGYVKGAFTGAEKDGKIGQIEMADQGTVLLDEIGELPMNLQTKLLRVLQDKQIMRVGSNELIDVDIRILAATNRNLEEMVKERTFREDLFYRLNVVPIHIPPLKGRMADIKLLIENCLERINEKFDMTKSIDKRALRALMDYDWPGNVRELENVIEYLLVTTEGGGIREDDLPANIRESARGSFTSLENITSMKEAVSALEIKLLKDSMAVTRNTEEMAAMLKMDRSTVTRKLQKYGIKTDFKGN